MNYFYSAMGDYESTTIEKFIDNNNNNTNIYSICGSILYTLPNVSVLIGLDISGNLFYADNNIYNPIWKEISIRNIRGNITNISYCNKQIVCVTDKGFIFYTDNYLNPNWKIIRTDFNIKQANLYSYLMNNNNLFIQIQIVDVSGNVYRCTNLDMTMNVNRSWLSEPLWIHEMSNISSACLHYYIDTSNNLYNNGNIITSQLFTQISNDQLPGDIRNTGMYGIYQGSIWYFNNNIWIPYPGPPLTCISYYNGLLYGLDVDGNIYYNRNNDSSKWYKVCGQLAQISINF